MGYYSKIQLPDQTREKLKNLTDDELLHTPKKSQASTILGVISIILALIALIITSDKTNHSGEGLFLIFLIALPLMISSLIISIVGLFLSSKKLIGRRLSTIGLILTFSPIAVAFAPNPISSIEEWVKDKLYNTFVDGVKFNKKMTVLINYPWFKKGTNYIIPDTVTSINETAFVDCDSLISITISNSVTSIGNSAFNRCRGLTSITIPDSVTSIGCWAFSECTSLESITISDNLKSIDWGAFSGCRNLKTIAIPDSVTIIGDLAFNRCSSLTSVTIPNSVTIVGESAFGRCSSLKYVTIPNSVTIIEESAFDRCSSLKDVIIPDSVTSIRDATFFNCKSLTTVTFHGDAPKEGRNVFKYSAPTIYRKPEAKGWGDTWGGRPVKLISEKP